jgi:hypothetical protein
MNLPELQHKLVAAARADAPSDCVPYAFEKRIMARLQGKTAIDFSAIWARALWRAAASCVALTLLLSAWSWLAPGSSQSPDLSQALENTVLAETDQEPSAETLW